jgi:hypothetical protein
MYICVCVFVIAPLQPCTLPLQRTEHGRGDLVPQQTVALLRVPMLVCALVGHRPGGAAKEQDAVKHKSTLKSTGTHC